MKRRIPILAASILFLAPLGFTRFAFADAQRGTLVHEETIRISPSADAARLGEAQRGHELIILDTTRDWVHVEAILMAPSREEGATDEEAEGKTITGWIPSKAFVASTTQDGDRIIFGEAADSEDQASSRRGRRDAAQDAMRLYYRVYDLMPASPLAAEALYRAADIRWQIERSDVMTRPSARQRESYMRGQMKEDWMKLVIKKYPTTKWADLAAFRLLENKLCGDWEGLSKCPDKEAEIYEKYAAEFPDGPRTAQALYLAVYRLAVLNDMYKADGSDKKADEAHNRANDLLKRLRDKFPQSDYTWRAGTVVFKLDQNVPVYGIDLQ